MVRFLAAAVSSALLMSPVVAMAESPIGVWMTAEKDSKIRVANCGKALCATILWAKATGVDENNPNPSMRDRKIIGLDLSRDMRPDGSGGFAGSIYNPENGKTYKATMNAKTLNELEVGGCVLGGLLCGSETWTRVPDNTASVAPAKRRD